MALALRRNAGAQDETSHSGGSPLQANPGSGAPNGSGNGNRNPANPTGDSDLGTYEKIGAIPIDEGDLEMTDIEQGQIGDCWLLADACTHWALVAVVAASATSRSTGSYAVLASLARSDGEEQPAASAITTPVAAAVRHRVVVLRR